MSVHAEQKPWTVPALADAKRQGRRLAMLTAYDAGFARVMDRNGIDLVLVETVVRSPVGKADYPWAKRTAIESLA